MQRGYIKVWRKIADAGWFKNHKLCTFWLWCLTKASHKEFDMVVGCQNIHLMPGDFIFGRKVAALELDISEQSIRTILEFLKNSGNLTIKTTNKFSIISIINWNTYQGDDVIDNQQINKQLTSHQPATNHKQTHKHIRSNISKFIIPTIGEIISYCQERNNKINPETFLAHYNSNGWMVGKNKMKDWKAAIITWEGRNGNGNKQGLTGSKQQTIKKTGNAQSDGEPWPEDRTY